MLVVGAGVIVVVVSGSKVVESVSAGVSVAAIKCTHKNIITMSN